jgi:hypothetical protein
MKISLDRTGIMIGKNMIYMVMEQVDDDIGLWAQANSRGNRRWSMRVYAGERDEGA